MKPDHRTFAVDLAKRAGKIIRENFSHGMEKSWKADETPLTVTDTAINQMVVDEVRKHFPDYGLIAEEGGGTEGQREFTWVCDPVDGTIPFSHGLPLSGFSLGLTRDGVSQLGVFYDPFMGRLFVGERGKGATMNGKIIHVADRPPEQRVFEFCSWNKSPYDFTPLYPKLAAVAGFVFSINSIVYSTAMVASGEYAATIFAGPFPWDAAAISVIVQEAGGQFTDLFGKDQRYDRSIRGFIASNGVVHDDLVAMVATVLKEPPSPSIK